MSRTTGPARSTVVVFSVEGGGPEETTVSAVRRRARPAPPALPLLGFIRAVLASMRQLPIVKIFSGVLKTLVLLVHLMM